MSACIFFAADFNLPEKERPDGSILEIDFERGMVSDGNADDDYGLYAFTDFDGHTELLKAFVKGVRGYFSYYLRRFSLCFCLNNAFQPVLRSQTATMVKKHFDFIICFALLNHKNSIRFVFLRMVIWGG